MKVNRNFHPLARKHLQKVLPYSSAQSEFESRHLILLNANENPLGGEFCRYPISEPQELQKNYIQFLQDSLSSLPEMSKENLLFTNGSDEGIDMLIRCFCEPGKESICVPVPSFSMYESWADANNVEIIRVPLEGGNFDRLPEKAILESGAKILFLCTPNNPVGTSLDVNQILKIASQFQGIIVVDEAYQEFSRKESILEKIKDFNNIVILRTFSKAWGMAGLRLGVVMADALVLDIIKRIKAPYNVNSAAEQQALEYLKNISTLKENISSIQREKELLIQELSQFSEILKIFPSDANFLLIIFQDYQKAYQSLLQAGIVVRDRSKQVSGTLRITIGTIEENRRLLDILKKM